jgi:GTP-binding protein Era
MEKHYAGYIGILGYPNAGKSSISNVLVGERISIINKKAQTTRHSIYGMVNGDNYQMVFCDTPGILEPKYKLQESMMHVVNESLDESDIVLAVWDVVSRESKDNFIELLSKSKSKKILVLNKVDLITSDEINAEIKYWKGLDYFENVIPLSALKRQYFDILLNEIRNHLPEHPPYFPKDQLTDKSERFIVSEIIREKILANYHKEIPYSAEVRVQSFKDEETIIKIAADILLERDSQKGIVIGKGGRDLKRLGTQARHSLERFFGKKIFLDLSIKVRENWRNDDDWLKKFGYKKD